MPNGECIPLENGEWDPNGEWQSQWRMPNASHKKKNMIKERHGTFKHIKIRNCLFLID